jgi:hypothetical protein
MPRDVKLRLDVPNLSFTDAVGRALGNLGHGVGVLGQAVDSVGTAFSRAGNLYEKAGDEMFRRAVALQEVKNETAVNEAVSAYDVEDGKAQGEFFALKGNNAVGQYPKFLQDTQDRRKKFRDSLTNPAQQRAFDSQTMGPMGRSIREAGRHTGAEQKHAYVASLDAKVMTASDKVKDHPWDDQASEEAKSDMREAIDRKNQALGNSKDVADVEYKQQLERLTAKRLTAQSEEQPSLAWDNFQKTKDTLPADIRDQVEHKILDEMRGSSTLGAFKQVMRDYLSGKPDEDRNIQQRVEDGTKLAAPALQDHPKQMEQFEKELRQRVEGGVRDYNQMKNIEIAQRTQATYEIMEAPKAPLNREDFKATPEGAKIWAAANPKERSDIEKIIYGMANREFRTDPITSRTNYNRYLTEWLNDREKFMESMKDLRSVYSGMNGSDRREILNFYKKAQTDPKEDPDSRKGMKWLQQQWRPSLQALGIEGPPRRGEDSAPWNSLNVAVYEAFQDWKAYHQGQMPSQEEFNKKIAPDIIKSSTGDWLSFFTLGAFGKPGEKPYWAKPIPPEWESQRRLEWQTENNMPAADMPQEQLQRDWIKHSYRTLAEGGKKEAPSKPPKKLPPKQEL